LKIRESNQINEPANKRGSFHSLIKIFKGDQLFKN
jgi:hypothetical protein